MLPANPRDTDRELMDRILAHRPHGVIARRVAAYGVEHELDIWALQRAMAAVHSVDLRRWRQRDPQFCELVRGTRRDLWRAYLRGYVGGLSDDAEQG
jgi:hypothetical protein